MLDRMKQVYQLQKQARAMQKELKETEIEAQGADGKITVVFNGELKLEQLSIDPSLMSSDNHKNLERDLAETLRQGLKEAQKIAAEKSQAMMKEMGIDIPGL